MHAECIYQDWYGFSLHVFRDKVFRGRTRRWTKCAINVNGERNSSNLLTGPKRFDISWLSASVAAGCRDAYIRARMPRRTRNSNAGSGTHTYLEGRLYSTSPDSPSCGTDKKSVTLVDYIICNQEIVIEGVYLEMDIEWILETLAIIIIKRHATK